MSCKTMMPSRMVLSFENEPAGRSLYSVGSSTMRYPLSSAWMLISVSIPKPLDKIG